MKTTSMKKLVAVSLLALTVTAIQAKSWRIHQDAAMAPDFTSINAAMSSADVVANDTLYLDPGSSIQGEQTISKQVTIVGCGYFRNTAPHNMASIVGLLKVQASNVKIEGTIFNGEVYLYANNITLERCYAKSNIRVGANSYSGYYHANNCTIRQCYTNSIQGIDKSYNAYTTIENCIIVASWSDFQYLYFPTIKNCYIKQTSSSGWLLDNVDHPFIENCIGINTASSSRTWSSSVTNVESDKNNIWSNLSADNTEANIFSLTGSNDERYQLKEGSPAIGAGNDGTDIGPSGGLYPYVLGGLPAGRPYFEKATVSKCSENDKVNVSLKIKMQNE